MVHIWDICICSSNSTRADEQVFVDGVLTAVLGRVRYIKWSKCISRTQEVNNVKEDGDLKIWKADSTGAIKASSKEPSIAAVLKNVCLHVNVLRTR